MLKTMKASGYFLILMAAATLAVTDASAQDEPAPLHVRAMGGASLFYAQPTGEFTDYVNRGFGLEIFGAVPVDARGYFAVRLEGGVTNYGSERARFPLSPNLGNLIMVDVTTNNNIFFVNIGPQVMRPDGAIRPYLKAAVGGSYFATQSSVEGSDNWQAPFAQTTNFDDFVLTLSSGGGFLIPIVGGPHPVMLDIGTTYHHNGPTRYLRKGSLELLADESVVITPVESRTSYFTFKVGVSTRVGY